MAVPLDTWQERLERHFEALAATRSASQLPLFALEHGLSEQELDELSLLLRDLLISRMRLAPHWLPWVVYATESGYSYAGDEYWGSFEERTPGWEFADRYRISPWFRKFQQAYYGVVPSGPWAEHFRIIAWPITHAILPKYLQRQFARALFDVRFQLASIDTPEPAIIGRMLAGSVDRPSTRFEKFLQQEELTGRIVLALLHKDPVEGQEPIYRPTLARIVSDLQRIRSAREWLGETQRVATDRFRGIGSGTGPPQSTFRPHPRPATGSITQDVRPRLMLRHAGSGTWSVLLDIPSFAGLAALSSEIRSFLRQSRCRLNGADDTKPAGWLLSGRRRGVLKAWPGPDQPLIEFEQSHPSLNDLLESTCRMTSGPVWLFRLAADGTAREITSRVVRPDTDYILIASGFPGLLPGMTPCSVACSGVKALRFSVPSNVTSPYINWLDNLNIKLIRTIEVWPAGLPGRRWDGEGTSEWLTTERPCFGFVHDTPVDAYVLRLDQHPPSVIRPRQIGDPVFVRLNPLSAGRYRLTVNALKGESSSTGLGLASTEGFIELHVREPEPWTPGTTSHSGLVVTTTPFDADLDTFWENKVSLSVLGPESHQVSCAVLLENGRGETILCEEVAAALNLPVTPSHWYKRFGDFLHRENVVWRYLEASAGVLTVKGDELGEFSIRFEREALPIRWTLRYDHGTIILRLIDDTGSEYTKPNCSFFHMQRPATAIPLAADTALKGIAVNAPGGLFVAKHDDHFAAIIVSTGLAAAGLKGLGIVPAFDDVSDPASLASTLRALRYWHDARLAGFLCSIRRQIVTDAFLALIYRNLCGVKWERAEAAYLREPNSLRSTDYLQHNVERRSGFAAVLRRDFRIMNDAPDERFRWFANLAARYGVNDDATLSSFALRLASEPHETPDVFGTDLESLLDRIRVLPALLRGARFVALLSANQNSTDPTESYSEATR